MLNNNRNYRIFFRVIGLRRTIAPASTVHRLRERGETP